MEDCRGGVGETYRCRSFVSVVLRLTVGVGGTGVFRSGVSNDPKTARLDAKNAFQKMAESVAGRAEI